MNPSFIVHLKDHRPACLADLADGRPAVRRSGGALHATHAIVCACGGGSGRILGHARGDAPTLAAPISLTCASCGHQTDLIDDARETRPRGARTPFTCPTCSGVSLFELNVVLTYGDAALAREDGLEDRFERFVLGGTCGGCSAKYVVAEISRVHSSTSN